jgi:PAS domain S-box-containing protein
MLLLFDNDDGVRDTLRFIEEKSGAGLWLWNLKSHKMEWSPGYYRQLGVEPGTVEPSYSAIEALTHPEDLRLPGEIERILSEGGAIEREFRILRRDGRIRWLANHGEILFDRSGKPSKAIGISFDITSRHEALLTAKAAEERYTALAAASSAMVWTVDGDGTVADMPGWRQFTGQTLAEVRGWGRLDALHPSDRPRVKAAWDKALDDRITYEIEFRVRRADGEYRWMKSRATPLFTKDGSIREWVGVTIEIHDEKVWSSPNFAAAAITGAQLRAARGVLNWSVRDLADAANVSASTIRRLEEIDGAPSTPENALQLLKTALESAGVEFLFPPIGKAGIRPR